MPDFRIQIPFTDISGEEIDEITADIQTVLEQYGIEDTYVMVSQKVATSYFSRNPGDDVIES